MNHFQHETRGSNEYDSSPTSRLIEAHMGKWDTTVNIVKQAVVFLFYCKPLPFNMGDPMIANATAFVVDAERGYMYTNRHVAGDGPFWGYCKLHAFEECPVYVAYCDPIHDFAILRFDPGQIRHSNLVELKWRPDLVRVGLEVRLLNNAGGDELSVFEAVISRIDRDAPPHDFNIDYIQASSPTTWGSSGGPVVDVNGFVIAMSSSKYEKNATNSFIPLDRAHRALVCLQEGKKITRGTIHTRWLLKSYDECRKLGLAEQEEERSRHSSGSRGLLVVDDILPKGAAYERLEQGDMLLEVNHERVSQFSRLEDILDSSIGQTITFLVQRGGYEMTVEVEVGDLHAITPVRFLQVAGATFHDISYQIAHQYVIPIDEGGVYVCAASNPPTLAEWPTKCLIQTVDKQETPNLERFMEVIAKIPDRARIVVSYKYPSDIHRTYTKSLINLDRHWDSRMRLAVQNDETGFWDFSDIAEPLPAVPLQKQYAISTSITDKIHPQANEIFNTFLRITCLIPLPFDGFNYQAVEGYGLIIDAEKGLLIVSRAIVPYDMCDIHITVANSIQVPGKILFLHPQLNFAVVQYDPKLVQAPVSSAKLSREYLKRAQHVVFLGVLGDEMVSAKTTITSISPFALAAKPSHRAFNIDLVKVETRLMSNCGHGVIVSEDGTVQALWMPVLHPNAKGHEVHHWVALQTPMIQLTIDRIQAGSICKLRSLDIGLAAISIYDARIFGLSDEWLRRLHKHEPECRLAFKVTSSRNTASGQELQESDILLAVNGRPVTKISDLDAQYDECELNTLVIRKGEFVEITVETTSAIKLETTRIVNFCGAVIHAPHHALRQFCSQIPSDVFISSVRRGSPAALYHLPSSNFITHINGTEVADLEKFLEEAGKIPDNEYFRIKVMNYDHKSSIVTMKKIDHYFPTMDMVKDSSMALGWKFIENQH